MAEKIIDKLHRLRQWREEMADTLRLRIAELEREKEEAVAMYDEELGALQIELSSLDGKAHTTGPSEIAVKAFNYLSEYPGQTFSSMELMSAIRCVGAVASVALREFIEKEKILVDGSGRSCRYFVPEPSNPLESNAAHSYSKAGDCR